MAPVMVAALFWKRSTKWGALAATLFVAASLIGTGLPARKARAAGRHRPQRPSLSTNTGASFDHALPTNNDAEHRLRPTRLRPSQPRPSPPPPSPRKTSSGKLARAPDAIKVLSRAPNGDVRFLNGYMTVVPMVFGSALCMILFSLLTPPPSKTTIDKYFRLPNVAALTMTVDSKTIDAAQATTRRPRPRNHAVAFFARRPARPFWLDWAKKAGWNPPPKLSNASPACNASRISRTNGCATCSPKSGCPKSSRAGRSTFLKPAAPPACPSNASAGTITRSITRSFPASFPTRISRAAAPG